MEIMNSSTANPTIHESDETSAYESMVTGDGDTTQNQLSENTENNIKNQQLTTFVESETLDFSIDPNDMIKGTTANTNSIVQQHVDVSGAAPVDAAPADAAAVDDLEDGEIETDDDDDDEPIITAIIPPHKNDSLKTSKLIKSLSSSTSATTESTAIPKPMIIGGGNAATTSTPTTIVSSTNDLFSTFDSSSQILSKSVKKNKFRRMDIMDDDWAGNIENAIAAALKKDGIEPPVPKLDKQRTDLQYDKHEITISSNLIDENNRRGRKRKKRDDKEKKVKRTKQQQQLDHHHHHTTKLLDDDDIDEDEMVCVRGGSPQHTDSIPMMLHHSHPLPLTNYLSLLPSSGHHNRHSPGGLYNDSDDSYQSSYDSYDSSENRKDRRQLRRTKDRRNRTGTNQLSGGSGRGPGGGGGGGGGGPGGKRRNRNDSDGEDCPRSHDGRAPRKLELCKFYLMDCCAKKDKCSYMHADFPCKYYYLGMECVYKSDCKFSHGDPLTEQLKNILLKHIETAPKEILGSFRRISRENATNLLLNTHAKLCTEKGVENTMELPPPLQSSTSAYSRQSRSPSANRGGGTAAGQQSFIHRKSPSPSFSRVGNPFAVNTAPQSSSNPINNDDEENWDNEDWDKPTSSIANTNSTLNSSFASPKGNDKPRKSRWRDSMSIGQQSSTGGTGSTVGTGTSTGVSTSDILSLKNLKGVISPEQIKRLEKIGIENLEQISQLTVGQLNSVGLTISQINEIQLNAMNIQKLGLISSSTAAISSQSQSSPIRSSSQNLNASNIYNDDSQSISQDVDMRCLVGAVQTSGTSSQMTSNNTAGGATINEIPSTSGQQELDIASPDPVLSSKSIGGVQSTVSNSMDFSQYLKDSNVKDADRTNFNDLLKEDKDDDDPLNEDEPELLIDESRCAGSDDEGDVNNDDACGSSTAAAAAPATIKVYTTKGEDDDDWDDDNNEKSTIVDTVPLLNEFTGNNDNNGDYWQEDNSWQSSSQSSKNPFHQQQQQHNKNSSRWSDSDSNKRWNHNISNNKHKNNSNNNKNDSSSWKERKRNDSWQKGGTGGSMTMSQDMWSDNQTAKIDLTWSSMDKKDDFWGEQHQQSQSTSTDNNSSYVDSYADFCGNRKQSHLQSRSGSFDAKDNGGASSTNQYRDPRLGSVPTSTLTTRHSRTKSSSSTDNYDGDWDVNDENTGSGLGSMQQDVVPIVIREPSPPPKYQRASIYDGGSIGDDDDDYKDNAADDGGGGGGMDDDDESREYSGDRDMRIPSFIESGDIDLRLPFKPVMTNYTPATEIDCSIASHAPITYKVYEVSIPKPDYSEIRRTMTATDKTLDPRLRRIFCLKESLNESVQQQHQQQQHHHHYGSEMNEMLRSPPHSNLSKGLDSIGMDKGTVGPRIDPRRRKESADILQGHQSTSSLHAKQQPIGLMGVGSSGLGQNVDIRMLLQKSMWYKNLNSKYKIMVNQQLALVSTELKKFHQDNNPDKVFDMKFLATNQYLQQVLTNLGIFIDGNGQILQLDNDNDDLSALNTGGGGGIVGVPTNGPPPAMMMPTMMMDTSCSPLGGGGGGMEYMRSTSQPGGGPMNSRFMGGPMMNQFVPPRFGNDIRPGLLGISPTLNSFNPFDTTSSGHHQYLSGSGPYGGPDDFISGNPVNPFNQNIGSNDGGGGGGKFYGGPQSTSGGNRGRNYRQGGGGNRNDRWSGGPGGNNQQGRNNQGGRNRNYGGGNRGGGGGGGGGDNDRRNDKDNIQQQTTPPQPEQPDDEEETWD